MLDIIVYVSMWDGLVRSKMSYLALTATNDQAMVVRNSFDLHSNVIREALAECAYGLINGVPCILASI